MPHFMVRKTQKNPYFFNNAPQTGKRFFYELDYRGYPQQKNTVINYEFTLCISQDEFIELIKIITGDPKSVVSTAKFGYHLPKEDKVINHVNCINALGLPNTIKGDSKVYTLNSIGIAANYDKNIANGNILFIYTEANTTNEVCISIHIAYSAKKTRALDQLTSKELPKAVSTLNNQKELFKLNISDDFSKCAYTVTMGMPEYFDYIKAYNQEILDNQMMVKL